MFTDMLALSNNGGDSVDFQTIYDTATTSKPISIPCTGNASFVFTYNGWSTTNAVGYLIDGEFTFKRNVLNVDTSPTSNDFNLIYDENAKTLTFTTKGWDIFCFMSAI